MIFLCYWFGSIKRTDRVHSRCIDVYSEIGIQNFVILHAIKQYHTMNAQKREMQKKKLMQHRRRGGDVLWTVWYHFEHIRNFIASIRGSFFLSFIFKNLNELNVAAEQSLEEKREEQKKSHKFNVKCKTSFVGQPFRDNVVVVPAYNIYRGIVYIASNRASQHPHRNKKKTNEKKTYTYSSYTYIDIPKLVFDFRKKEYLLQKKILCFFVDPRRALIFQKWIFVLTYSP